MMTARENDWMLQDLSADMHVPRHQTVHSAQLQVRVPLLNFRSLSYHDKLTDSLQGSKQLEHRFRTTCAEICTGCWQCVHIIPKHSRAD